MAQKTFNCRTCGKEHFITNTGTAKGFYCSNKCQLDYQSKMKIDKWLNEGIAPGPRVIKKYLIATYGEKCYTCGITEWNGKSIVFDTEHIDGNSQNNRLDNLCLICPNCHSQTDTYKNRNKGNGRHSRRVRYAQGKSY